MKGAEARDEPKQTTEKGLKIPVSSHWLQLNAHSFEISHEAFSVRRRDEPRADPS
jgi:hypothetical protein